MTMRFIDLLKTNSDLSPAKQQQRAADNFSSVVENSHMKVWRPGEELSTHGRQLWIAVASYSIPDLEVLDNLEAKLAGGSTVEEIIHLFDLSTDPDFRDFENIVPGIGQVYQTPVIGLW